LDKLEVELENIFYNDNDQQNVECLKWISSNF